MTEINRFCILGERCTGTNYLQKLMETNFNLTEETHKYGWKHFFGFSNYENSDDVLFIGIVRDPFQWLGSLNKKKHHLAPHLRQNMRVLLRAQFYSIYDEYGHGEKFGKEVMQDRNMFTGKRYKNIIELRNTKNKFLLDIMDKKVKNYILIRYEDLSTKTFEQLEIIRNKFDLKQKNNELINIIKHTKKKGTRWDENKDIYKPLPHNFNFVIKNIDLDLEHRLGYLTFLKKNNESVSQQNIIDNSNLSDNNIVEESLTEESENQLLHNDSSSLNLSEYNNNSVKEIHDKINIQPILLSNKNTSSNNIILDEKIEQKDDKKEEVVSTVFSNLTEELIKDDNEHIDIKLQNEEKIDIEEGEECIEGEGEVGEPNEGNMMDELTKEYNELIA